MLSPRSNTDAGLDVVEVENKLGDVVESRDMAQSTESFGSSSVVGDVGEVVDRALISAS